LLKAGEHLRRYINLVTQSIGITSDQKRIEGFVLEEILVIELVEDLLKVHAGELAEIFELIIGWDIPCDLSVFPGTNSFCKVISRDFPRIPSKKCICSRIPILGSSDVQENRCWNFPKQVNCNFIYYLTRIVGSWLLFLFGLLKLAEIEVISFCLRLFIFNFWHSVI